MKIFEIYNFLNTISPFDLSESWDNCGLILGSFDDDFEDIYLSIDLDLDLVEKIKSNSLVITHHPLIFSPLKRINFDNFTTKILQIAIKKDIKLISMHTNFDKTHLNNYVFEQVLGFKTTYKNDFIVEDDVNIDFDELVERVQNRLGLDFIKFSKSHNEIKKVALTTGSGGSLLDKISADTFLTADIKYHEAMQAKALGINLMEIGHYESEKYFGEILSPIMSQYLKKNNLKDIITNSQNPFCYRRTD